MVSKKQKRKSAILDDVSSTGCKPAKSEPVSVKPEPEKNDKNPAVSAETVDFDSADILKPKSKSKKKKKQAKEVVKEMEQSVEEEEEEDDLEIVATNQPEEIKIIELASKPANPEDYSKSSFLSKSPKSSDLAAPQIPEEPEKVDVRQTEDKTIFVKNLPFNVTVEEMKALFINAVDVRLLTKNNGHCRGKAFVEMNSVEKAESASQYKQWTLKGRKLEVDLCGAKSKTSDSRANIETSTVSLKVNCEFDLDDLSDIFTDPCDIRIPVKGPNIAYIQFEDKETAKKYFNKNLEVNGEPIAMKYVPDRITVVPKREKGEKWEKKKEAKRQAAKGKRKTSTKEKKFEEPTVENSEIGVKSESSEKSEFRERGFRGRGNSRGRGDTRGRGGFRGRGDRGRGRGDRGKRGRFEGSRDRDDGESSPKKFRSGDRGGLRGRGESRGRGGSRGRGDRGGSRGRGDRGGSRGRGDRGGSRGRGGFSGRGRGGDRGRGSRGRGSDRGAFKKPSGAFKRD